MPTSMVICFSVLLVSLLAYGLVWSIDYFTDAPYYNSPYCSLFYGPYTETPVTQVSPFSLSEYYNCIEKVQIDILQEKQKMPKYTLVLWFGLDGLQLDDNGHSKWISRGKKEVKPRIWASCNVAPPQMNVAPPPIQPCVNTNPFVLQTDLLHGFHQLQCGIDAGFKKLHSEMQQTCCCRIEKMPPALVQEMLNDFMLPPSVKAEIERLKMENFRIQIQDNLSKQISDSLLDIGKFKHGG